MAAGLQLVLTVGDHHIAGIDSARDNGRIALRQRDGDSAILHRLVRTHDVDERSMRTPQDGRRRNYSAVLPRLQKQIGVHELVRPQFVVFVVEDCFQLCCARRCVDLVVDREQLSGGELGLIVSAEGVNFKRSLLHVVRDVPQHVFAQA